MASHGHPGALVQGGTLVGAHEAAQGVLHQAAILIAHGDAAAIHRHHLPVLLGVDRGQGVPHHPLLEAGHHHRGLGPDKGHRLGLHVGTHEGPVGVVVLQEGDEVGVH